jgi:hypothetical protein
VSGAASFDRPTGATVERELVGVVAAPADRVFADLATRLDPHGGSSYAADPASGRIIVQGDYWYRGEYDVAAADEGSRVTYTIVNVSPGWQVLGRLTGHGVIRAAPRDFAALLASLG